MIDFLSISVTNVILIILLVTVLVFFCLYIYTDNKKLKEQIEELRKENKSLLEKKIINQVGVDSISIKNISDEKVNLNYNEKLNIKSPQEINTPKEEITYEHKISKDNHHKEKINNYAYSTSVESPKYNFNINELVNKNNHIKVNNQSSVKEHDYLQEIQIRMNEELKPQTIELTDYEKKQEEQAVISYKELLKFKDNNYIIDEKQETINFIEELKNLRNSLK